MNITIPIEDLLEGSQKPRVPTIEASGKAVQQQAPKVGRFHVTITEKAPSREAAWVNFEQRLSNLRDDLGTLGEVGNVIPTENKSDVTKGLRTTQEYSVGGQVDVTFTPAVFGQVIAVFIALDLPFSKPDFTFEKSPEVSPVLLTAAAADARVNAAAVAMGVGMKLGRLISINIGPPLRTLIDRPLSAWRDDLTSQITCFSRDTSFSDWKIFEDKLETYDTEVEVTVVFEVIDGDGVTQ